ncbi:hypothetical protein STEG23_005600 [Scotinomys teguina]
MWLLNRKRKSKMSFLFASISLRNTEFGVLGDCSSSLFMRKGSSISVRNMEFVGNIGVTAGCSPSFIIVSSQIFDLQTVVSCYVPVVLFVNSCEPPVSQSSFLVEKEKDEYPILCMTVNEVGHFPTAFLMENRKPQMLKNLPGREFQYPMGFLHPCH